MVSTVFDQWTGKIRDKIADAQLLGLTRQDLPAEQLAQMLVATIEGGTMQSRL
jgi:hypothetical protein